MKTPSESWTNEERMAVAVALVHEQLDCLAGNGTAKQRSKVETTWRMDRIRFVLTATEHYLNDFREQILRDLVFDQEQSEKVVAQSDRSG